MNDRENTGAGRTVAGFGVDDILRQRYVTVPAAGRQVSLSFEDADRETVAALLPQARAVLAAFARLSEEATAFLWAWGAEGDESAEEAAAFLASMNPTTVVIGPSGAFALHYEEVDEEHFLDGYWPAVHFTAGLTPEKVTVEA
ncbi:hypothetical protein GCM10010232_60910 [Streptomyces amakusaensis]|uniref:Uncharacterized protein n=1 Tax=Streptomyces amakusaensis TaxID=67271 RepID=A0ABW0ARQ6_9ACTN